MVPVACTLKGTTQLCRKCVASIKDLYQDQDFGITGKTIGLPRGNAGQAMSQLSPTFGGGQCIIFAVPGQ